MTLGDFYTKYTVFISSVNGKRTRRHRHEVGEVMVSIDEGWTHTFPWETEVLLAGNEYILDGHTVTFNLKSVEFTTESFYQAEVSGGFIPVNILNNRKLT